MTFEQEIIKEDEQGEEYCQLCGQKMTVGTIVIRIGKLTYHKLCWLRAELEKYDRRSL